MLRVWYKLRVYYSIAKKGFMDYLSEKKLDNKVLSIPFSLLEPEKNNFFLSQFFKENKNVGGIVVLNSRGNITANYMHENNIDNIKLVCVNLTQPNKEIINYYREFNKAIFG